MPLSSADIAAMNGAYMQQYAMNAQYAGMIGGSMPMYGGTNRSAQAEGMAGSVMNRGMAIGAPLATAGMALAGLDPMSLAIRGGMASYGAGAGFGGSLMAGAALGGAGMIGMGAMSYMGNQMFTGASQTQSFNQGMRGSFHFANPATSGGRGFGQGDLQQIGGLVRSMAGTGEQGFDELGRLAQQMGRMGMAEGVRNAKEFGEKFREMLKTVKTIATEMNTTLEEAQTMMASMRGSGIFNKQAQVAGQIRQSATAGGLATTEVTGMMNIGSQISRMYGGTGRQGAMGGMEAITQVGVAQQAGIMSEEDIYNATGQTGAEGRRAMAMQQMQNTGSFLKSSKGRWFLASLAGRNGQLDQDSVNNWMAGGMDVEQTRSQAHRNLHGVGRANFIRNEGRLRGAVMEQFGGLAPGMAMLQWAQGKGIDINEMDDRSMLFAQRQLGMGRDEADMAIRMARKMPEMLQARRAAREDDMVSQAAGQRQQHSGLEGIKRRFDEARNQINNEMQKVGQDLMNEATNTISRWANRLADTYEERSFEGIRQATRSASMGGAGGARAASTLGIGFGALTGKAGDLIKSSAAGISAGMGGGHVNVGQRGFLERIDRMKMAANMGEMGQLSGAGASFVESNKEMLQRAYAEGGISGLAGEDRISAVRKLLGKDTAVAGEFKKMTQEERAGFVQQLERGIGVSEGSRLGSSFDQQKDIHGGLFSTSKVAEMLGSGGLRTEADRDKYLGNMLLGGGGTHDMGKAGAAGAGVGALIGGIAGTLVGGPLGGVIGAGLGAAITGGTAGVASTMLHGNKSAMDQAAGAYMRSEAGRSLGSAIFSGDKGALEKARKELMDLQGKQNPSQEEKARMEVIRNGLRTADIYKKAQSPGGFEKLTNEEKALLSSYGGAHMANLNEANAKVAEQVRTGAIEKQKEFIAGGLARFDKGQLVMTDTMRARLEKGGGKDAVQAMEMAIKAENIEAGLGATAGSADADRAKLGEAFGLEGQLYEKFANMDVKSLRGFAQAAAGTSAGQMAAEQLMLGRRMNARLKRPGKGGAAGAVAAEIGIDMSPDELAGLKGLSAKEAAARISGRLGGDEAFAGELTKVVEAAQGGKGQLSASLLNRAIAQASPEVQKKIQEAQGKGPDPLEKIATKIGDGNRFLEALVRSNDAAKNILADLNSKSKTDGEKGAS